jgi:hypothetical protein
MSKPITMTEVVTSRIASQMLGFRLHQDPMWTQADMALAITQEGAAMTQALISRTEAGYRKISLAEAVALARVMGITLNTLVDA